MTENDEIVIFQAPVIEPAQCRVYYDDKGMILFYTCDKPEGNYLIVDIQTYAEGRLDLIVKDGILVKKTLANSVGKLKPNKKSTKGTSCHNEDVSVVTSTEDVNQTTWKYDINE